MVGDGSDSGVEFAESVVEPNAWRIKGVGMYGSNVDVVSLDSYHELAAQSESFKRQCQNWALSAIRLRKAIEQHKASMEARFAETQGDPNEHDQALWSALDAREGTSVATCDHKVSEA